MMGVGRTAIREALQPLILLGLVEVRQGDGTYLRGLESNFLPETVQWGMMLGERPVTDLVEARRYVEVGVAELAAERRDERDLNELKDILEKMRKEESAEEFTRLDIAFHERLAQASRNTVFRGLVSNIRVLLGVWIKRNIEDAGETLPIYKEHPPILEAVAAGDRAKAGQAMAEHLDAATGRLRESLQLCDRTRRDGSWIRVGVWAPTVSPEPASSSHVVTTAGDIGGAADGQPRRDA